MRVKKLKITEFKRFTDLTITDLPESAKLVVLVGPNGSGKTSLFEAFNYYYRYHGFGNIGEREYLIKQGTLQEDWHNKVAMEFYEPVQGNEIRNKFYFRTAYRNEADFTISSLNSQGNPTNSSKFQALNGSDITVSENYQRLVSKTLAGVFDESNGLKTVEEYKEELIGKVRDSLSNVFSDLKLSSIGDPLSNGSFYFEKGISYDFHYKNLSAGEKSVFDILLDLIIKSEYYPNTIFCIDEPEAHMHTSLQSKLLEEMYRLIADESQLWISTHSIGMLKKAQELEKENPGTVIFLSFDNKDFDLPQIMKPSKIDKAIWDKFLELAFNDFSHLVAPKTIVFCEGNPLGRKNPSFDAQVYYKIFNADYYDTSFISVGSCNDIENPENPTMTILSDILKTSNIIKVVDRDDKSDNEVKEMNDKGIKVLKRRHLESYLLDDEIINKLCREIGLDDKISACIDAKNDAVTRLSDRGKPIDDIKSAAPDIYISLKRILNLSQIGSNPYSFLRDTMAPLVTKDTKVYKELEQKIFS